MQTVIHHPVSGFRSAGPVWDGTFSQLTRRPFCRCCVEQIFSHTQSDDSLRDAKGLSWKHPGLSAARRLSKLSAPPKTRGGAGQPFTK